MCDLVQMGSLPFFRGLLRFLANLRGFFAGSDVWGPAQILTMGALCDRLVEAGFTRVDIFDVTEMVLPTLRHWRENALRFREVAADASSGDYARDFAAACEGLEKTFREGLMGYGMLRAWKEA